MLDPQPSRPAAPASAGAATRPSRQGDADLARRIASGDRAALGEVAGAHFAKVFAIARRILGNDAEAEDVCQEVFLKLWRSPPDLENSGALMSTWLYRVTTNRCFDWLRRTRPDQIDETVEMTDDSPGPEELAGRAQVSRVVEAALERLPARQRAALVLTYYEGLSNREAADLLETGIEAVESLVARARRALRADLVGQWDELLETLEASG